LGMQRTYSSQNNLLKEQDGRTEEPPPTIPSAYQNYVDLSCDNVAIFVLKKKNASFPGM
jgi:hypothetical protein